MSSDQSAPSTITISRVKYNELMDDSLFLQALREGGVDNWDWYGQAQAQYDEWKAEAADPAVQDPDGEAEST